MLATAEGLRIVIVEDEDWVAEVVGFNLRADGHNVRHYNNPNAAKQDLPQATREIDVLVADLQMPGTNGMDVIEAVYSRDPTLPTILLTANHDGYGPRIAEQVARCHVGVAAKEQVICPEGLRKMIGNVSQAAFARRQSYAAPMSESFQ